MSKFLSLEWFKSKIEHSIDKVVEKKFNQISEIEEEEEQSCPYKNIKLVNDVLVIVFNDGQVVTKSGFPSERFQDVCDAKTKDALLKLISSPVAVEIKQKEAEEIKKQEILTQGIELLKNLEDFVVNGNSVQLIGTNRTLPQLLVEKFIMIVDRVKKETWEPETLHEALSSDEEYQAHKNFFMWCCLNPRAEVADDLYDFLEKNSFRITKQGFFVALRNVVTVNSDKDKALVMAVSNFYNKVKAVWKKKSDNYRVVQFNDGEYAVELINNSAPKGVIIGNLTTLYLDLPNMAENRYTDAHTRTFDIRVGQVVNMPMEECSWSTADCMEAGLHFTSDEIHYVGCGDQSMLIIINPMKVVGIGSSKGRCYEYLPIMTVAREEATKILHDGKFDTLQLDEQYAISELEKLEERTKQGFTIEANKYEFNLPQISSKEIKNIVQSLNKIKEQIKDRVVNI